MRVFGFLGLKQRHVLRVLDVVPGIYFIVDFKLRKFLDQTASQGFGHFRHLFLCPVDHLISIQVDIESFHTFFYSLSLASVDPEDRGHGSLNEFELLLGEQRDDDVDPPQGEDEGQEGLDRISQDILGVGDEEYFGL